MTLDRNKPPLNFRSRWHTDRYIISFIKSHFNFQNDFKSQNASVEFQIPLASRQIHNFLHKITFQFPEWPWIATSHRWISDPVGIPKATQFPSSGQIPIYRMTLNRNKPPLNFRSRWHTERYIISFIKSHFDFQNDLESYQATVEFQIPLAYRKIHNFLHKITFQFPEWLGTASSHRWISDPVGIPKDIQFPS